MTISEETIIKTLVLRIKAGKLTIEEVPEQYRERVQELLK